MKQEEKYFELKEIDEVHKIWIFKQALDVKVRQWLEDMLGNEESYEIVKKLFLKRYWGFSKQGLFTNNVSVVVLKINCICMHKFVISCELITMRES